MGLITCCSGLVQTFRHEWNDEFIASKERGMKRKEKEQEENECMAYLVQTFRHEWKDEKKSFHV